MVSGYFLGVKIGNNNNNHRLILFLYCRRLLILIIFWYLVYIFIPADWRVVQVHGYARVIYWNALSLFNDIDSLLRGPRQHLWFFSALLIGAIHVVAVLIVMRWRWSLASLYFVVLYLFGLANGTYAIMHEVRAIYVGHVGHIAMPPLFIFLGMFVARRFVIGSANIAWFLFLGGTCIILFEAILMSSYYNVPLVGHDMFIGTPFQVVGLLALLLIRPDFARGTPFPNWGMYALGVYAIHVLWIEVLGVREGGGVIWEIGKTQLVFFVSLVSVIVLSRINKLRLFLV